MKARDIYNYDNPKFAPLREPMRAVVSAYQAANRYFDTCQEYTLIEQGLVATSKWLHSIAHTFPLDFDGFIDVLHELHLMGEYPETPELDWRKELTDMQDVFGLCAKVLENNQEALETFYAVTDNAELRPLALKAEEMMLANSAKRTELLEGWAMYDEGGSKTSFDNWIKHLTDKED